jgi:tRNA A37 N6-isopentenylltransferase MiaA
MTIEIPAEIYQQLQVRAGEASLPIEAVGAAALAAALKSLPARGRYLVVSGGTLEALETILSGGSIMNQADLRAKVENLAGVSFEHCRLPFTPNQLEQLAEKAERNSMSVQQLIDRTAPRIYEQFFDLVHRS